MPIQVDHGDLYSLALFMSGFNMERSDRIGAWLAMIRMEAMTGRGGKVEFERVTVTAGH